MRRPIARLQQRPFLKCFETTEGERIRISDLKIPEPIALVKVQLNRLRGGFAAKCADKEQFMRKERPGTKLEARQELMPKHGRRIMRGYCHDCSQGSLSLARDGFEYWNEEGDGRGFWFCRYCGSNHVTVTADDGVVVEQGDIYDADGLPNF